MLFALLIAAQAPDTPAPVVAPLAVPTLPSNAVAPSEACPAETVNGIIIQGGKTAREGIIIQGGRTAREGIIVQGGRTADAGIIVQGGLQPAEAGGPSDPAAKATAGKCGKAKL